jgi:dihydrodipicolinate synthase/N-acetylneuraminate lyase
MSGMSGMSGGADTAAGGAPIDGPPPLRPRRRVTGMSAVLLPFDADGSIAWNALAAGIARTAEAGLVPAVNMDTSYGPNLDPATRRRVLAVTAEAVGDREPVPGWRFVGGAHVDGERPGLDLPGYKAACLEVAEAGGVPIVFPSAGLAALADGEVAPAHAEVAGAVDRILGFELGVQFHPDGRIWPLGTYGEVLQVPGVVGAKHSSLRREPEWARLALRDARRPEFLVLTGNDLAIDMVRWGSDYLLGLSAFAPAAFALRDRLWAAGDRRALAVDDALQALGALAFRVPVPAYRHDAALVWHRRGWAPSAQVHPASPTRPPCEVELLATLLDRLDAVVAETGSAPA